MKISRRVLSGVLSIIATIAVIGAFAWYSTYRSTRALELQATRAVVAWVFEGQPIPNFEEVIQVPGVEEHKYDRYGGSAAMREAERWYVICDFLPQGVALSDNPKIERISEEEAVAILDQAITTRAGSFLFIYFPPDSSKRESIARQEIRLNILTSYAVLGGDMYEFLFTKIDGQLKATGWHTGGS